MLSALSLSVSNLVTRDTESLQILGCVIAFPHESHNGNVRDASDPGVADEVEVERCQPFRLVRITGTRGFSFEQTLLSVQVANGIDIGHKLVTVGERTNDFLLHVSFGLANADSVISGKLLQQSDLLAKQAFPVISVGILERNFAVLSPLLKQHCSSVLALEKCR